MANKYNAATATKIKTLFTALRAAMGNIDVDYSASPGFRVTLTVTDDGQNVILETSQPSGQNNAFGAAATPTPPVYNPSGALQRVPPLVIPATDLP